VSQEKQNWLLCRYTESSGLFLGLIGGVFMKLSKLLLSACLLSVSFLPSLASAKDLAESDPALLASTDAAPIGLTPGTYTCTDAFGGTHKMEVTEALKFNLDGIEYTQSDAINGGNSGPIKFTGKQGNREITLVVTTETGGQPPYKITYTTADGVKQSYICQQ
jgi:hypothetical protein